MPTVAELDVQINAKDDASATILALDALIKNLDGDDVDIDIDANTEEVQAKIRELLLRLQQLDTSDPDIDIDINGTGEASAELAALRAELAALRDETITIRMRDNEVRRSRTSMDSFRNSATQASRSVNGIAAAVLGLGTALIPLGAVLTGGIAALTGALVTAGIGTGLFAAVAVTNFSKVKETLKLMKSAQEDFNKAVDDEERDQALAKMKKIMDDLDPATRKMVESVMAFKTAWRSFASQFQPVVFDLAQKGLAGIAALLPSLAPIIAGTAGAFQSLEKAAFAALMGPFWQSWLKMIGNNVAPIMNQMVRALGNFIKGFAGIIGAFMPLTRDFSTGLLNMSRRFAAWGESLGDNKGFQNFVGYIRENTPLVMSLIHALSDAFVALVKAGAPLGEGLVIITTALLNSIAAFQRAHPAAATLGLALIGILAVTLKLLGPVLAISRVFTVLGSALLSVGGGLSALAGALGIATASLFAIIAVLAAVVVGLVYAYNHFEGFRRVVDAVAGAIADFAVAAYQAIVSGLGKAASWMASTFGPIIQTVIGFVVSQFNKIRDWGNENGAVFAQAWRNIATFVTTSVQIIRWVIEQALTFISAIWTAIWPTLLTILQSVWTAIKGVVSGAVDVILGILLLWGAIIAGDWGAIWQAFVQIASGIWQIILGLFQGFWGIMQAIAVAAGNALMGLLGLIWQGIQAAAAGVWASIVAIVQFAWNAILTAIRATANAIQAVLDAFWAAVFAVFRAAGAFLLNFITQTWSDIRAVTSAVWNGILSFIRAIWNSIVGGVSVAVAAARAAISNGWNGAMALTRTVLGTMRDVVVSIFANIVSAVLGGMGDAVNAVYNGVGQMIANVASAAGRFYSAGLSLMVNLASGIVDGIGNAVGAVRDAVGRMTALLPGSPAKVGPLSGEGYALIRGQHFSEDLAAGIAGRAGLIATAAGDIADLMTLSLDSGAAFAAIARGTSTGTSPAAATTINIQPGAITVAVGEGVDPKAAREAFDGAGTSLADDLLTAMRRQ